MNHHKNPNGIAGLVGREPISAALTIGCKGPNGAPIDKDRFYILVNDVASKEYKKGNGDTYKSLGRELHPAFASFNSADPARRRNIPARLAHATIEELFAHRLQAASGAKGIPVHPKKAPVCRGNGQTAIRWDGKDFQPIVCPGDRCPYSQPGPNDAKGKPTKPACGKFSQLIARFDFPISPDGKKLPSLSFKFSSGSVITTVNFVGFFDRFMNACKGFGIDYRQIPLFGMPVSLSLSERTNPDFGTRYPVVTLDSGGDADIISWIQSQLTRGESVRALAASAPLALADLSEDELAADVVSVSGPLSVPAAVQASRPAADEPAEPF